jgi:actin related protein 2/3 complex subunit 5
MAEEKADKEPVVDVAAVCSKTDSLISGNNFLEALKTAIATPPSGSKDEELKKKFTDNVLRVFEVIKEADIQKCVDDLDDEQRTTAMKYVFKGLATGKNCAALLKWHQTLTEKCGLGIIMRTMVDRKL